MFLQNSKQDSLWSGMVMRLAFLEERTQSMDVKVCVGVVKVETREADWVGRMRLNKGYTVCGQEGEI